MEIIDLYKPGTFDCIITDPPYGMNFQSNRAKDGHRHKKIENDSTINHEWIGKSFDILHMGGGIVMFCNWATSSKWEKHITDYGFKIVSQAIWDRCFHGMGDLTGGFAPQHDVVWYATKGRRILPGSRPKSVMRFNRPMHQQDNGHPTCKPVELMEYIVKHIANGWVLDPFMGSGSTGVACKRLGVPFTGIEIDSDYFNTAKARIENQITYTGMMDTEG